jgi:rod shape-determining protein MreC
MRKRPARKILALLGLGAVLVLAGGRGWISPLERMTSFWFAPVGAQFGKVGRTIGDNWRVVTTARQLADENRRLGLEVAQLRQRLVEDVELRQQNEVLREQLGFVETVGGELLPAQVIAYQPDNFRQFLTIGRGSKGGVKEGMAVVAEGSLVGKISEVTDNTAKVFLVIDPNFRVNGLDQDSPQRATGTVRGQVGAGLLMDRIPQDQAVKPGDTVITSGLAGEVAKGLVIGRVESVNQQSNAVFQTAQLVSPLKFHRLELVFVVKTASDND